MLDLYLKNGLSIKDDSPLEVAIRGHKIVAMGHKLEDIKAHQTINLQGKYISAGWIDDHVHCYEKLTLYYDDPDEDGYKSGVTTVIDAGSTGAENIDDFYDSNEDKITNVYAMINVGKTGILAQNELGNLDTIEEKALLDSVEKYQNFIVGIKVRESHSVVVNNGVEPLKRGKKFQKELGGSFPIMVHVGANPPDLKNVVSLMDNNDILTHVYNGKPNGIIDKEGNIHQFVWEAYKRGVTFDVGHGTDSFNFNTFDVANSAGLVPKSISTDIYSRNRINGPVYDMATTMEKFLMYGFSLSKVVSMVTEAPAKTFNLVTKGKLEEGYDADLTVFELKKNVANKLVDSNQNERIYDKKICPQLCVVMGKAYEIGE
ncbi:amidohydrolase/deacetylase family metallohydrolase [Lactobacillus sp. ESL0684]|uniref:amidohydrolase/deacetylase family metallohydrolase n=1 Tax=Lactobacillus sp. ESL0684 TaxID=2983213 RepID=UPI0023F98C35|nr:amidohydrolase/deacetylase family metallohydrolase [Lactobacillus sp. ESL0684]WEV43600.1 amidohydrolase/deacetylase family metallohydrolase [Lactobacillus sp. ESL0684]